MTVSVLYHGSDHIIQKPDLMSGKITNDYGRGFYCTLSIEMAKEWACKRNVDGFVNSYQFDDTGLKILNLLDGQHTVLNWIALLLKNRTFTINDSIARDAKDYIIAEFAIDTSQYDVVIGYRADDSYFSYAQSFIHNALPVRTLYEALRLGNLGQQTVLCSDKAFENLTYTGADYVDKTIYYRRFLSRDTAARNDYFKHTQNKRYYRNDIFVLDILRGEIKNDDPRIQRIVLE